MRTEPQMKNRRVRYQEILQNSPVLFSPIHKMEISKNDPISIVAGYVLAPALSGFVQWLLAQAEKNGIRRLYFLARDGYFPCQAARIFCQTLDIPIECRYLSVSRYSLRLPLFHLDREMALHDICRNAIHVTITKLLQRAGIKQENHENILQALALPYGEKQPLSRADLIAIRQRMAHCPEFLEAMEHASKQAFPALMGYLRQEGLFEDVPYAIVDSGWLGSMQKSLQTMLRLQKEGDELQGYYWGLYRIPTGMHRKNYHCYFFEPEHHLKEKVFFNNSVYEAVFSAPHGTTIGYRKDNKQISPIYGACPKKQIQFLHRIKPIFDSYLYLMAKECLPTMDNREFSTQRETIGKLLALFMCRPTKSEASAFGSLPFSDDVLENGERPLAANLTEQELQAGHLRAKLFATVNPGAGRFQESAWYEASAVLHSSRAKRHLRQYTLYKYLRHFKRPSGEMRRSRNV